jgi:predicted lipoprotein with Yx(FWY)xxD motif
MNRRRGLPSFAVASLVGATLVATSLVAIEPAGAATQPTAPAKPLVVPGKSQVKLIWTAPKANGSPITGYVVTPFLGTKAQPARTFKTKATTQVITGLKNAIVYTFKVAAKNKLGTGPRSVASNKVKPTVAPTLRAVNNAVVGQPILVDSYGFTLYLYLPDGASTKSLVPPGPVKVAWPPIGWSGKPTVGAGLTASKIKLNAQTDRVPQVSYNGHLLYYFVTDTKPGDLTGQGVANFWVVSPAGNKIP